MYDRKNLIIKFIGGILIFALVYYLITILLRNYGISSQDIKHFVENLGPLGIIVLTILMALSVMSPLPDSPTALVANILYGPVVGFFIVIVGSFLGAVADFLLFRKFGRTFFQKKFPILTENLNRIAKRFGFQSLVFLRIFPTVTFDIASYLASVTKIKLKMFMLATIIGLFPLALTYSILGYGIESDNPRKLVISVSLGLGLMIIVILISNYYGKKLGLNNLEETEKTKSDNSNKKSDKE